MQQVRTTIARLLLVSLTAGFALFVSTPAAHACDMLAIAAVKFDVLSTSTPTEINSPDGPFRTALGQWRSINGDNEESPTISSITKRRTVIEVSPPADVYASNRGVTIVEAVWGRPGDLRPEHDGFDQSNCVLGPPALGDSTWSITIADSAHDIDVGVPRSRSDEFELELTRLFGEALYPERDFASEEMTLSELLQRGEQEFGQPLPPADRLTPAVETSGEAPDADAQLGRSDAETASAQGSLDADPDDGGLPELGLIGLVLIAFIGAAAATLYVRRRI